MEMANKLGWSEGPALEHGFVWQRIGNPHTIERELHHLQRQMANKN
jgi:hypothetical protein